MNFWFPNTPASRAATALAALLLSTAARSEAQTAGPGSPADDKPVAIVGARVLSATAPAIDSGSLLIAHGRIVAMGRSIEIPTGAKTIDGRGKWVTPGLTNSATGLGITEIPHTPASDAQITRTGGVASDFRPWDGLSPGSSHWADARNAGVTTVLTGVMADDMIVSGEAALVRTVGATRAELIRRAPAALYVNLRARNAEVKSRGDLWSKLRQAFQPPAVGKGDAPSSSPGARTLAEAIGGKILTIVAADRSDDIEAALALASEHQMRIAILGGAEAWKVASKLARANVPVIVNVLNDTPMSYDYLGSRRDNAAILNRAGVQVMIHGFSDPNPTTGDFQNVGNVRVAAGVAVANGMPWDDALRALTLTPARVFGINAEIGSLEVGKAADLVVWDGDPFQPTTLAEEVFINGTGVKAPSRRDSLTAKYK